ncbi:G-protein coupled receptor 4-like [Xyrichtys novacula]|uniref:G-protein coupled receptor 4-like n=1 Tax=Xyrichtys novacula TaxID=13765 RepID=A0AAV1G013_XYRNO|nr:G-protein coupled receptor 4-like [Xyrichtys novacula]
MTIIPDQALSQELSVLLDKGTIEPVAIQGVLLFGSRQRWWTMSHPRLDVSQQIPEGPEVQHAQHCREDSGSVLTVATYIIFSIGMPLTLMAIYSAYFTVRSDPVAAIYVFNLIIADLIQLCCMFISEVPSARTDYIAEVYLIAVQASIGFMVSLAIER